MSGIAKAVTASSVSRTEDGSTKIESERQQEVRWLALLTLSLGLFAGTISSSAIEVVTPAIKQEFAATDAQMSMLITISSLALASSLLLFGKVGHVVGLRRFQAIGIGLFGLSSLLIGLAPSIEFIMAMHVFSGLAAAMVAATGLALVHGIFKGKDRSLAFGLWGAMGSLGIAMGPVIGGLAVTYFSWRAAFFVIVPICLFIIAGCRLWVVEVKHDHEGSIDFGGAAIIGAGLFLTVLALINGPDWGWWTAESDLSFLGISPTPWLLVFGFVLICILFPHWLRRREAQGSEPIFDLGLLKVHSFRGGMLAAFARQIAQFAPIYALAIFLEETADWTASQTGLMFVMSSIGAMIAGPSSGWLANRWGTKPVVIAGKTLMAVSILWILLVIGADVESTMLFVPLFLFGVSIGLAGAQLNTVIMAEVPVTSAGDASAAKASLSGIGNSFGAAFVGILLVISINDVLIMALIFIVVALALAFTLPNIKDGGTNKESESG